MSKVNARSQSASVSAASAGYNALLAGIREEISSAQAELQRRRVLCYWNIGHAVNTHILKSKNRAGYGSGLLIRLARDTGINKRTLHQLVKFSKEFPKPDAGTTLNWTAYRQLLGLKDTGVRLRLIRKAQKDNLSSRQIGETVKAVRKTRDEPSRRFLHEMKKDAGTTKLSVKLGKPYTYRLAEPAPGAAEPKGKRLVDAGFNVLRAVNAGEIPKSAPPGTIVESVKKGTGFSLVKSARTKADLYTYHARVFRVVDGDTVILDMDLGFRTVNRVRMRLNGLNAPELSSREGKRAKRFVQRALKGKPLIVKSHRLDIYGRYLADVFILSTHERSRHFLDEMKKDAQTPTLVLPSIGKQSKPSGQATSDWLYLNQKLLDNHLAVSYNK